MWKELYHRLHIKSPRGAPVSKTSKASLEAYESRTEFRFPSSYKKFVTLFGPGEIGGYFNVFAPGYSNRRCGDLVDFQRFLQKPNTRQSFEATYGNRKFLQRMVPFGNTIGGDVIVWDPEDIRSAREHEYGVWVLLDDSREITELADSFADFIVNVCLGSDFHRVVGESKDNPLQEFAPFVQQS